MYAAAAEPDLAQSAWSWLHLGVLALLFGWFAERVVEPGVRIRGLAILAGVAGIYAGPTLWTITGLAGGPRLWGYALVPGFLGSLAVCAFLRLVSLGVEGPRR